MTSISNGPPPERGGEGLEGNSKSTAHLRGPVACQPEEEFLCLPDKPVKGSDGQIGELRIYHYATRTLSLRTQFDEGFFPSRVRFTPDGRKLVAVDATGKLRAWDFTPAKK